MRIYFGVYFENLKCAMSIHSYTSLGGASFIGELWVFGAAAVVVRFQFRVSAVDWTLERPPQPAQAGAALFVPSKQQQAAWRSAWGRGRPGMHGVARQKWRLLFEFSNLILECVRPTQHY